MNRGSNSLLDQYLLTGEMGTKRSTVFKNCLNHKGVINLGIRIICVEVCRLILAFRTSSRQTSAAAGAGVQTKVPLSHLRPFRLLLRHAPFRTTFLLLKIQF